MLVPEHFIDRTELLRCGFSHEIESPLRACERSTITKTKSTLQRASNNFLSHCALRTDKGCRETCVAVTQMNSLDIGEQISRAEEKAQ